MNLADVLDDGKPKAGAADFTAARLVDPKEPLENSGLVFLGNAGSVIPHPDLNLTVASKGRHLNRLFFGAVFNGVVHQVDQGLLQQGDVHLDDDIRGAVEFQAHPAEVGLPLHQLRGGFHDPPQGGAFKTDRRPLTALLQACQGQQIIQNVVQAVYVALDDAQKTAAFLGVLGRLHQGFDKPLDGRQGGPDFVGNVGHEIPAHIFQAPHAGYVVQHHQVAGRGRGGSRQRHAVGVEDPLQGLAYHEVPLHQPILEGGFGQKLVKRAVADDLVDVPAFYLARGHPQHAAERRVEAHHPPLGIDGHDPFHHAGQHGFKFIALCDDRIDPFLELGRHLVHSAREGRQLARSGHLEPVLEVAGGKLFSAVAQLLQRTTDPP